MPDYLETYRNRTPRSAAMYKRALKVMPGGVCHNPRFYKPYPVYLDSAGGSRVRDIDGNEYVDVWMGHYALILGHNPPVTRGLLQDTIGEATHWGIPHESQVVYAEDLCRVIPCIEELRFCVTGTEATMYAVRLARAATGRKVILKARGGWHGGNSDLSVAVHAPMDEEESAGLPAGVKETTGTVSFNDLEGTVHAIRSCREDLAGVIIEAMNQSFIGPEPGYLEAVKEEVHKAGGVLIFDEVITGGRLSLRGAQGYYGVTPDVTTMGKVLGGGMPLGIIGGRKDILELASPLSGLPKSKSALIGGGTFSAMPPAMRAGRAVFNYLEQHESEVYPELERKGRMAREGIAAAFDAAGVPARVFGVGSLFSVQFPRTAGSRAGGGAPVELRNVEDVETRTDMSKRNNEFKVRMMNHGVYMVWGGGALSMAHTGEDVERIVAAAQAVAKEMAE